MSNFRLSPVPIGVTREPMSLIPPPPVTKLVPLNCPTEAELLILALTDDTLAAERSRFTRGCATCQAGRPFRATE